MHKLFWVFITMLLTMTLISSLGGGLRYTENFMDDILDDSRIDVSEYNLEEVKGTLLSNEAPFVVSEESVMEPSPMVQPEEPMAPPMPSTVRPQPSTDGAVQAFDGDAFASF